MASSATTTLRMELMATGENDTTWGTKINTNFQIMESAVSGTTAVSTTGGDTTLTNVDYTNDQAKKAVLDITGTLVSNAQIIIPNAPKVYRVLNRTSGAYTVGIKTSSGSAIVITQSTGAEVYCDGSNTMRFVTPLTDFTTGAPATSSGAAASSVSVTPTGNLSSTTAQAAFAELQGDVDTINAALPTYQPLDSDLTAIAAVATAAYGRALLAYSSEATFKAGVNLEANTDFYAPGGTDVPVTDGGTGSSTAAGARTNLGVTATGSDTTYCYRANNLSDVTAATAFSNIKQAASDSATGVIEIAVQSEMETGTSTTLAVTPGRQHYHPGHPKFWMQATVSGGVPTLAASYNMTSITDTATGRLTGTIATDFSSANWCGNVSFETNAGVTTRLVFFENASQAAGSFVVQTRETDGSIVDPGSWSVSGLGDQA